VETKIRCNLKSVKTNRAIDCNEKKNRKTLALTRRHRSSDEHLADAICTVCGVVATRLIFEESEWRDFAEDEVSKSRVGAATSIYGDSNLDTQIAGYNRGGDRFAPRGSIARSHAQLSGDDAQEHQYVSKMSNIADILQLPAETKDMAHAIYKDVRGELKNAQGQKQRLKRDGLCAALLFIAGKKTGSQRTFKAIAAMTSIPEKDIRNAYKSITRYKPQLAAESSTSTVESLVSTFAAQLDVPQRLTQLCITVANNARSHAEGKLPQTVAAAAMYLVLSFHPQVKADLQQDRRRRRPRRRHGQRAVSRALSDQNAALPA
jgi:transcription initiation factor TFIIIB Brf1 subunit/transcription initiation factor TFIIB